LRRSAIGRPLKDAEPERPKSASCPGPAHSDAARVDAAAAGALDARATQEQNGTTHNQEEARRRSTGAKRKTAMTALDPTDARFLRLAYEEARTGYAEGGCPIGSVLAEGERLIARGRNRRVQQGDPIAHGEMDCLRNAGRRMSYRRMTLYTSLSPCMMCAGAIIQFGIPRVVIGEDRNFAGNADVLRARGIEVIIADDRDCVALMAQFIAENPKLWNEDIMEDE
jgi:cytosine/creatinine deaminase